MPVRDLLSSASGVGGGTDPNFNQVSLLLNGDGTNGAQNNTFLDSSSNNFTITRNGNTTQGSFSPYGNLWSNYFNQSAFLQSSATGVSDFGTGNYTFECWVNSPLTSQDGIYDGRPAGNGSYFTVIMQSSGQITLISNSGNVYNSSTNVSANTWTHIAIVRGGTGTNQCALFINGVRDGTFSDSTSYVDARQVIGAVAFSPYGVSPFLGYISNMRFVKGTAVYSYSNTTITVPTAPLTAISGTSLLTCQSNRFIDNSSNNIALSVYNSGMSVQRFSPFNPTATYSTTTIGGSMTANGSSANYLSLSSNSAFDQNGPFTIECWAYPSNLSASGFLWYENVSGYYSIFMNSSSQFNVSKTAVGEVYTSPSLPQNCWYYLALSYDGTNTRFYINGTLVFTGTGAGPVSGATFTIGDAIGVAPWNGYISDLRFVKSALYTGSTITVPTAPLTAVTNTSLLTNFTNAGIPDLAMQNDLQTVGSAQVSTSVKKYGTGSLYFNGSSDNLQTPITPALQLGTNSWTIEGWFYFSSVPSHACPLFDGSASHSVSLYWDGGTYSTNTLTISDRTTNQLQASWTPSANTWYHVAAVRNGTTYTLYINGTSIGNSTSSNNYSATSGTYYVGGDASGGIWYFPGYIDDFRITNGLARYTSNFTPPTAALPTY